MKKTDLFKLATKKVLDDNYCILSIKSTKDTVKEIAEIGIIDKDEEVVYEAKFKPLENGATENVSDTYFKNEYDKIMKMLSEYDYVVMFNDTATKKVFTQTVERYGLNTRVLDKVFKKAFCVQTLYGAYIGFMNARMDIACKVERIDVSNTDDIIAVCSILQNLIKTVASEYTHPSPDEYASLLAKSNQNAAASSKPKQPVKNNNNNKKNNVPKKTDMTPYYELYKQGKTVKEIADAREVKVETVEANIIKAYEVGAIDNIDSIIQTEYVEDILKAIANPDWDGKLKPIKEVVPEDCTYLSIKGVIAKNKKGCYVKSEGTEEVSNETSVKTDETNVETTVVEAEDMVEVIEETVETAEDVNDVVEEEVAVEDVVNEDTTVVENVEEEQTEATEADGSDEMPII